MADWIFLDHHTRTRPSDDLTLQFAKEAKSHWLMGPTKKAKEEICEILGFPSGNIRLKANRFESHIHLLFYHYIESIRQTGRTHILTLENEQESILSGIKHLEKFEVQGKILPVNDKGQLTGAVLQEAVRARSSLLSLSFAHPKTGVIQPIHDLIRICRENDIQVHLDISAAIGKLYFQLSDFDADFITLDGALLGIPFPMGVILSKHPLWQTQEASYAQYSNLAVALKTNFEKIETYAMETARLRDLLEKRLKALGAKIPYYGVERLPNVAVCRFEGIHSEQIIHELKKEGIFVDSVDPFSVSFVLSDEEEAKEIDRLAEVLPSILEKLQKKRPPFTEEDAKAKNMRLCPGTVGKKEEGREFTLALLIDEEDGIIADAQFHAFGPPSLHDALDAACSELLRKNYMQARRMTADLIEKKMSLAPENADLNLIIDAIDAATECCMDIPIEDIYVAPPDMGTGERTVYPGWETLNSAQKKAVIAEVIERDIRPYVELDAGGVDIVKVEDNRITIAYSGNCTSCFSATGATLDAIGNILRHKIFPDLMVIADTNLLQN
ncbi:MAG: Cysteine desulfurase IscS [Chlamydiae bacterium]|nr:Cysteine desulfurase IscS [Chlamydiota bacterium]